MSLDVLVSTVLKLLSMNFGYCVQYKRPLKKHYWYFLIPPSGPASGSRGCWKMESWGPGIQSLEAFNINFGYFVQHTCPLKKNIISIFWYNPQGKFQAQEGAGNWAPEALASTVVKLSTSILGIFITSSLNPTTGGIMQKVYNNFMMEIGNWHFELFLTPKTFFDISIISKTKEGVQMNLREFVQHTSPLN